MVKFMETLGYECDLQTMAMTGKTRQIYFGGTVPMIDVFFDKLDYCHEVNYEDRLELDPYSVSLTDILLQKLQIWEINDKDLKDIEYLFTVADFGEDDTKKINVGYIAKRLADDWGFWYTATTNLDRVKDHVDGVDALDADQKAKVKQVADEVLARIDRSPRPRSGRSAPRRAPRRSGTTPASPTGEPRGGPAQLGPPRTGVTARAGMPAGIPALVLVPLPSRRGWDPRPLARRPGLEPPSAAR